MHHVTVDLLRDSFFALNRDAAPGADGVAWPDYADDLEPRLADLHARVHRGAHGGPAMSMLHLSLEPGAVEGTTKMRLTDSVFGETGPGLRGSLTSGWQAIIAEGFIDLAEKQA